MKAFPQLSSLFFERFGWPIEHAAVGEGQCSHDSPARTVLRWKDFHTHNIIGLEEFFIQSV